MGSAARPLSDELGEFRGRRVGSVPGSFVATLAEQKTAIILCRLHANKFDPKPYHYFRENNQPVNGQCDDCREIGTDRVMFLHESLLGVSWTPRSPRR